MQYSEKELKFILDRLGHVMFELNEWETKFITDITEKVGKGVILSRKQMGIVSKIWDRLEGA